MVVYEIVDFKNKKVYQSDKCIQLRGNNGLVVAYLQDTKTKLHVVEVENYHTQMEVRTDFEAKSKALDYLFSFKDALPKLPYHLEKIATTDDSLYLDLSTDMLSYTLRDPENTGVLYSEEDVKLQHTLYQQMVKAADGKAVIVPDYSTMELKVLSEMCKGVK